MKRHNRVYIKYLVLIVLFAITNCKAFTQIINSQELFDIIDLYVGENYDIVLAKLTNMGFELKESTPDYSVNNTDYKADFTMMQPYECPDLIPPHNKHITYSYIRFKTTSYPSEKFININFMVNMPYAKNFIQYKIKQLEKEIGPPEYLKNDDRSIDVKFRDKKEYYGKDVEDPTSLRIINSQSFYHYSYFIINYSCITEYPVLEGEIVYDLPRYPVENPSDFFKNIDVNKSLITVPVKKRGNAYFIEINIGGKNLVYIIDSGASEMFISNSIEKYLLDLGVIRNSDYLPSKTFTLADGSEKNYRRVKIPVVRIGTIKVEDVEAAISEDNSPMLLGKSLLDKFKYWKINNEKLTIELMY